MHLDQDAATQRRRADQETTMAMLILAALIAFALYCSYLQFTEGW
jgi:hypothetical protein